MSFSLHNTIEDGGGGADGMVSSPNRLPHIVPWFSAKIPPEERLWENTSDLCHSER